MNLSCLSCGQRPRPQNPFQETVAYITIIAVAIIYFLYYYIKIIYFLYYFILYIFYIIYFIHQSSQCNRSAAFICLSSLWNRISFVLSFLKAQV